MTIPRKYRKLFQDAIVVEIPLNVTADMGVAIQRTRAKRIDALYRNFPSLQKTKENAAAAPSEKDEEEDAGQEQQRNSKKQKPNAHQPRREQYGSMMDYLEAKYVRGVVVPDEEEEEEEDRGSVYSETSFLDDTQLKSDLAGQVLSHSTQTKVEKEDKDEFFVNVGTLEVEEHDLMDYDPLEEEEEKVVKKEATKKRKRSSDAGSAKSGKSSKASATAKSKKADTATTKSPKKKAAAQKKEEESKEAQEQQLAILKQEAMDKKEAMQELYDSIVQDVKAMTDEDLPRKNKTARVSVLVPEGKQAGDLMMFSNPHIEGQRLKVKVPKGYSPGGKFVVSVPAKQLSDDTDNNNFTREFRERLDEFATTYDEWCHAEGDYREAAPDIKEKFAVNKEKMNKFDKMSSEFPSDLVTPVDAAYLKKLVRRARQNRSKRAKRPPGETEEAPEKETVPQTVDIIVPGKGRMFPKHELRASEFEF